MTNKITLSPGVNPRMNLKNDFYIDFQQHADDNTLRLADKLETLKTTLVGFDYVKKSSEVLPISLD